MKRYTSPDDVPYTISVERSRTLRPRKHGNWDNDVVLEAPVVGSDGRVRDERHRVIFGAVKVTRSSVRVYIHRGTARRPDEPFADSSSLRGVEVAVPKVYHTAGARRAMLEIRRHLVFLLAPQHLYTFSNDDVKDFCKALHDHIVVRQVMTD